MTDALPDKSDLIEAIEHALLLADKMGELQAGCHLSAALDALPGSRRPLTALEVEAILELGKRSESEAAG